jgi:uncharacterized protein with FMN-binding domain
MVRTDRTLKRAPAVIAAGAIAGFAGVVVFHSGAAAPAAAGSPGAARTPSARATPTGPGGRRPAGKAGKPDGRTPGSRAGRRPHHAPARPATRTATGPQVNFGYGTIAVKVTVAGTRITHVSVAALSTLEPTSQQISGQALPVLRSEVLSVQSATINGVSGATYTSQGYARSLQAALDQMHV